jgi:predicted aminopeptidase
MPILGCTSNLNYILTVGAGQMNVLTHSVSLDEMINDSDIDQEEHDKLVWVRDVRDYAHSQLGLTIRKTYRTFYDTDGGPAVYNLSASKKESLSPKTWKFPILGEIQYLGYFKLDQAKEEAKKLEDQNYDITIYGALAYSTLGYFKDPVFSSILVLNKAELANVVVHELTHNTIYKAGDSEFNESVASFVGQKGGQQFIIDTLGEDSELLTELDQKNEDEKIVNTFLTDFYTELETYYARTDLSSDEKIAGRDALFQSARDRFTNEIAPTLHTPSNYKSVAEMPTNNAWILLHHRYNKNLDIFENVYQACGQNLPEAIKIFKQAEGAKDSYQYLSDWLTTNAQNG